MTATPLLDTLTHLRFPEVKWSEGDRPVLIADGRLHRVMEIDSQVHVDAAYVVGVNQKSFDHVTRYLRAATVQFYEMRVADISALARNSDLEALAISWNTKLESIEPLGALSGLTRLSIDDTPKVRDLGPIERLTGLRAFEYSGGIWNKNTASSLAPLGALKHLEELRLTNLRVLEGGLRPLAGCSALRRLDLSNQFQTADYAYLSVALPETTCDMFAPFIPLGQAIGGKDVMVVGSGKPFLDSTKDADRLRRYVAGFGELQAQFTSELGPEG